MSEMYGVFCSNILDDLKDAVKGYVNVMIKNDILTCIILRGDQEYRFDIDDITYYILHSCSSELVSRVILKTYRRSILKDFFKNY